MARAKQKGRKATVDENGSPIPADEHETYRQKTERKQDQQKGRSASPNGDEQDKNRKKSKYEEGIDELENTFKKMFTPSLARIKRYMDTWLSNFRVKVGIRILYIILSSYGSIAMIREHPTPIFRGWTALFIILFLITNALLALAISDRELKICWVFLRSLSTWRFFWAFYSIYPQQFIRLAGIVGGSAIYAYVNRNAGGFDRKAWIGLCVSLFLVASDTPRLRKTVWTGENATVVQIGLGLCTVALLGGWRVYRWLALIVLYFANDALLIANFIPANTGDRIQLWSIAASTPCLLVYHFASLDGLKTYFALVYAAFQLLIVRQNSPTPDILSVRTTFTLAIAILLEVFVHGFSAICGVLVASTLLYMILT